MLGGELSPPRVLGSLALILASQAAMVWAVALLYYSECNKETVPGLHR